MLNRTKQFMREHDLTYKKEYIRPMMTPEHVYVFRFGKHRLNNRVIIRYSHTWTGRVNHQHHPRIFKTEDDMVAYLAHHLEKREAKEATRVHTGEEE